MWNIWINFPCSNPFSLWKVIYKENCYKDIQNPVKFSNTCF